MSIFWSLFIECDWFYGVDGGNFYLRRNIFMPSTGGSANAGDYMSRIPAGHRGTCASCGNVCGRVKYQLKQRKEYNICTNW
jgi:hypothetical protein